MKEDGTLAGMLDRGQLVAALCYVGSRLTKREQLASGEKEWINAAREGRGRVWAKSVYA